MSIKKLHSIIYWALPAFIILIGLWALGALYASDAPSSPADKKTQDQKKEPDKNAPKKGGDEFGIKISVNLVTTDVSILGRPTSELNAEDFVIYDDGVAQPVTLFSQDQLPIAVGLLIDASLSTEPYMPVMQLSGISALRHLKLGDKAVLYTFYGQIRRHTELTDDIVQVVDAFSQIEIKLGTRIYDAIIDASNYLNQMAPHSRRAIILISDDQNQNMGTPANPLGALSSLLETSTTLYNVLAQSTFGAAPNQEAQESVEAIPKMVMETGGEYFDVTNPSGLQAALANAMVNIRKQYTLGFNPTNPGRPGAYHRLEVKLASQKHCPGCVLRTRKGYYSGAATSTASRGAISKPVRTAEETDELLVQKAIMSVAYNDDFDFKDIRFEARSIATTDANNKPVFKIDLKIPAQNVGFRIEEGRYVAKLRVALLVRKDLRIITSELKGLNLRLSEETYKKNLESGILFSTTIPQKADKSSVKIVIYDMGTDLIGSVNTKSNN
jgi:Ca-activated chloride channel homolog